MNKNGAIHNKTNISVLIVEDDSLISGLLEQKFRNENYSVYTASSAVDAMNILRKETVHSILLDLVLPDMDGYVFLQQIKKNPDLKHIPVIIISNLGQKEEIKKGLDLGAVDYIVKANFLPGDIVHKVKTFCKINF